MEAASPASMRTAAMTLLVVVAAVGGCAEILGLEDPAGRLGDGGGGATTGGPGSASTDAASSGSGAVTGQGGAPGVGGGSSTGGSTASSTGAGGAPAGDGALELPDDFVVHALGTSDEGAVALVRRVGGVDGTLCGSPVPAGHLAVAAIEGPQCRLLTTISGENPAGVMIEQRGTWLGLISRAQPGPVTMHTRDPIDGQAFDGDAGMYGLWNVETPGTGFLIPTVAALVNGHVAPAANGSTLLIQNTLRFGFTPSLGDSGEPCETAPAETGLAVHFLATEVGGAGCVRPRPELAGTLLDAGTGTHTWALVTAGNCVALRVDADAPTRTFGACEPFAHLHVQPDGGDDGLFVGSSFAGPCGEETPRAGLVAHIGGQTQPLWCDDGVSTARVIPFHADATHVHFVRVTGTGAELWKAPLDPGAAEPVLFLCSSCTVRDAITSNGTVYVVGQTSTATEVLDEPFDGASEFWAWLRVDGL